MLFRPREFARAVAPWLAIFLFFTGIGACGIGILVEHAQMQEFSAAGRHVMGFVRTNSSRESTGKRFGPANRSSIIVDDPEMGPQVVNAYGELPVGSAVPMLCLTARTRCMTVEGVTKYLDSWPLTPVMIAGGVQLALACLLTVAIRRR